MPEPRKFSSLEDWRKAEGKEMEVRKCRVCNNPVEDPRHDTCRRCFNASRTGGPPAPRPAAKLPEGYLKDGYFTAEGHLRDELITTQAQQIAQAFTSAKVTTGQIRRFYMHLRRAARLLETGHSFAAVKPTVLEMKPLVADAAGRAQNENKDFGILKQFIDRNVDLAASGEKELEEGFVPHFQYVVAYFKYLNPKEGKG